MQLALYQPDDAGNAAAVLRLAACLAVPVLIVEPCGFVWDQRRLRRVGLDYLERVSVTRLPSWSAFDARRKAEGRRLVLLTTAAEIRFEQARYRRDDILLCGRESLGVPETAHAGADLRVKVPIAAGCRSLNVVAALAIVLGEALRQTGGFPP
ncbi:MAG: tRNA (cytidine(34)-2'-O)-methyltransferase [Geminicoccales bacterium]